MEFSNCAEILDFIKNNYCKLLLVNLRANTYCPKIIADDEVEALGDKLNGVFSDYTEWFCNSELIYDDDRDTLKQFFANAKNGKSITYRRKIGNDYHRVLLILQPTVNKDETLLYVRDVEEIYNQEKDKILEIDGQTSLYNRYAFFRDCKLHEGESVGIVFADVNGLKYTNDTYGHDEGDKLIIRLANLLKLHFREYRCYHLSGDEFVVASFGHSLQDFLTTAMAFHKCIWTSMDVPVASIGYSIGETGIDTIAGTVKVAEKSMYNDKLMFYQKFPKYQRK